jgi:hypothetical protein
MLSLGALVRTCIEINTARLLFGALGFGPELPTKISVMKRVGAFDLESRKGITRLWSI